MNRLPGYAPLSTRSRPGISRTALLSCALGAANFFVDSCYPFLGVPAVLLGAFALYRFRRPLEKTRGKPLAWAGVALGAAAFLLTLPEADPKREKPRAAKPARSEASVLQEVRRAGERMATLALALEAYRVDRDVFPPSLAPCLTTPVPYMAALPLDPFGSGSGFAYRAREGERWLLLSRGPDEAWNLDFTTLDQATSATLAAKTYDPANGARSAGDIVRVSWE